MTSARGMAKQRDNTHTAALYPPSVHPSISSAISHFLAEKKRISSRALAVTHVQGSLVEFPSFVDKTAHVGLGRRNRLLDMEALCLGLWPNNYHLVLTSCLTYKLHIQSTSQQ